jgi:hypothetical protein
MAGEDNKLLFTFEVDEKSVQKEMDKIKESGKDTASKLVAQFKALNEGGFSGLVGGVLLLNQGLELTQKIVNGIKATFNTIVDGLLQAEQIDSINKQFEILSKVAVGAGNDLKSSLETAANGLVDTEDLLQATNKVLIDFKGNANDLPRIFEAARKATQITGGDLLQTFQDLNQAIATGNTRVLRQIGINLDATEIQKKYALQLGKTVEQLTEFEKRSALTNSILNISEKQLSEISVGNEKASTAFKQLKVQIGEVGDSLAILTSTVLKPAAISFSRFATELLKGFNTQIVANFGSGSEKAAAQIDILSQRVEKLTKDLQFFQSIGDKPQATLTSGLLDKAKADLQNLQDIQRAALDDARKASRNDGSAISEAAKAVIDSYIPDPKEVAKRQQEFAAALISAQQQNLQLQIADAQLIVDEQAKEDQLRKLRLGQIELEEQNHLARLQALENQYQVEKTLTQAQYNELRNQENIRHQLQTEAYEAQSNERKRKQALDYQAKITTINQAIQNGILKTVSAAAERLGASLVKGGDAFADFQAVVLNIIGDIAIQIGTTLVGIGLGIEAIKASILTLSGGTAIAAGLALIALGGLLKSLSGGGGASADAGGSGGGGIASTPAEGGIFTPDEDEPAQKPGQQVVVNVQGNILDRRQTGLELAEVIRESFESQGTTIVGAV